MPHTFECPMRWADMDLLGHVNNVTYVDYLTEARSALFAGHPLGSAPLTRLQVEFRKPLVFRRSPVLVDTWVSTLEEDRVTLAHEVYDDAPASGSADATASRTVYLRASTVLAHRLSDEERVVAESVSGPASQWRALADEARPEGDLFDLQVRHSDLGEDGLARPGVLLEYAQEARIRYLMNLHTRGEQWSQHVVARTDVDYLAPVPHRRSPYSVRSWVGHLGRRSFTIRSEIRDGERVLARVGVVMVTFDLETQAPTEMATQQRARLEREVGTAD